MNVLNSDHIANLHKFTLSSHEVYTCIELGQRLEVLQIHGLQELFCLSIIDLKQSYNYGNTNVPKKIEHTETLFQVKSIQSTVLTDICNSK